MEPNFARAGAHFAQALEEWETDARLYSHHTGKVLDPDTMRAVLAKHAPAALNHHLHLNADRLETYTQMRELIGIPAEQAGVAQTAGILITKCTAMVVDAVNGKGGKGPKTRTKAGRGTERARKQTPRVARKGNTPKDGKGQRKAMTTHSNVRRELQQLWSLRPSRRRLLVEGQTCESR